MFHGEHGDEYISDGTTKITYGVFTGAAIIGLIMLGSLRVRSKEAEDKMVEDSEELTPLEMLSR